MTALETLDSWWWTIPLIIAVILAVMSWQWNWNRIIGFASIIAAVVGIAGWAYGMPMSEITGNANSLLWLVLALGLVIIFAGVLPERRKIDRDTRAVIIIIGVIIVAVAAVMLWQGVTITTEPLAG